jgi:cytoskeletal protein CcmA (bactofilin family)
VDEIEQIKKIGLDARLRRDESVIAASTLFKGEISGVEILQVLGRLEGEVKSGKLVWIHKGGSIEGNIQCRHVIINGKLNGIIMDAMHVEILAEAHVTGNIQTDKIVIAEGSFFKGEIRMLQKIDKSARFAEKRQTK